MSLLEKLDLAILDHLFQPIADKVSERWGKSCFWLAQKCEWVVLIALSYMCISNYLNDSNWILWGALLLTLGLRSLFDILRYEKMDESWQERQAARVMNPERLFIPYGKVRMLLFFVFLAIGGGLLVLIVLLTEGNKIVVSCVGVLGVPALTLALLSPDYFSACTPKPPSMLKAGNKLAAEVTPA